MNDETRSTDEQPPPATTRTLPSTPAPPPADGARTGWSTPGQASTSGQTSALGQTSTPGQTVSSGAVPPPPPRHADVPPSAPPPDTGTYPREPKRRRAPLLLAGLAIGAILGGAAGAGVAEVLDDDAAPAVTRSDLSSDEDGGNGGDSQPAATGSVQQVAEAVMPSVVSITPMSAGLGGGGGSGTGVIISSDGEILTNNHVVQAAGEGGGVMVTFSDGDTAEAEVVGTDPVTDLAVIKARDVTDLTPADLGSSEELVVGQEVVAIGSPLGLEGTVTSGIVSAVQRPVTLGEREQETVVDAIQTDAPINPGNSGGPLVDMNGQVVGINSAILTTGGGSIGLGFSIPIDQAKPIAEQLVEGQQATHAQIGVGVGLPQDGARGALITSVNEGSAGDQAGLREGDVVTRVDDRLITDPASLIAAVRSHRPDDQVTLTLLRDGEEQQVEVTLGSDAQGA